MKSTKAVETIIQPLWPGPGPATFDTAFTRAELFMYASRSATRCSRVGSAADTTVAANKAMPNINTRILCCIIEDSSGLIVDCTNPR